MLYFEQRHLEGDERLRDVCNRCSFVNYQNPRIIISALVEDYDQNLLINGDCESLPSDYLRVGETTKEAAARIVYEQTGIKAEIGPLLAINEVLREGSVVLTLSGRCGPLHGNHNTLTRTKFFNHFLTVAPDLISVVDVYERNRGISRFVPDHLASAFSSAVRALPKDPPILNPCRETSDCSFDKARVPKIVSGVISEDEDEKILMARRAIEPRTGYLTFPSGYVELGETLRQAAEREAREEAYKGKSEKVVEVGDLLVIYEVPEHGQLLTIFRGRALSVDVFPGPESLDAAFYSLDEIPEEQLAFPMVGEALKKYAKYKNQENVPPCYVRLFPVKPGEQPKPGVLL